MEKKFLHLSLACDDLPVPKLITSWLLGLPQQEECPLNFFSETHGTTISSKDLISFLTSNIDPQKVRQKEFYVCHQEAAKYSHEGESLWDSESNQMREFRTYVEHNWLMIP